MFTVTYYMSGVVCTKRLETIVAVNALCDELWSDDNVTDLTVRKD